MIEFFSGLLKWNNGTKVICSLEHNSGHNNDYSFISHAGAENGADDLKTHWTVHDVELALWSHHFAHKLNPDLLHTTTAAAGSSSRKRATDSEHTSLSKKSKLNS